MIPKNKIAGISIVLVLISGLIAGLAIIQTTNLFYQSADKGLQKSICQGYIISLNKQLKSGEADQSVIGQILKWTKDKAAENLLKSPYCNTDVEIFDLTELKTQQEIEKEAGILIGEMSENCWTSFARGKIPNTFGQDTHLTNYYFPCYKFKFVLPKETDTIKVENLINMKDGILWTHNVKKQQITNVFTKETFQENKDKYFDTENKNYLPYAGYISWEGYGYLEFASEVGTKMHSNFVDYATKITLARSSAVLTGVVAGNLIITAYTVGIANAWNPVGWAALAVGVGATLYYASEAEQVEDDKEITFADYKLTNIKSDRYYEVRYYAPYIEDEDGNIYGINGIKIVPSSEDSYAAKNTGEKFLG